MEKSGQKFTKEQNLQRFTPEEIELHNKNAQLRNKVSKKFEGERRKKTIKALGLKPDQAKMSSESSQLESNKTEINSEPSTSTSESSVSDNINKL